MRRVPTLETGLRAHARELAHAKELELLWLGEGLRRSRIVVVMVVRDEALRLPHVMEHYRALGAEHFLFIDNCSTDGTVDLLRAAADTTVLRADGSFRSAHYGIDWVNRALRRFCVGKWVVHVDADEYLVWGGSGPGRLPALCSALEAGGRRSAQAVMVDMYSERPASENIVEPGQDPLEVTDRFDADGYVRRYDRRMRGTWIKGGVRGRHFFAADLLAGPALNKTPLVRWGRLTAFVQVAHEVWPRSLNGGAARPVLGLLHFKFTSFSVEKVADEGVRSQHTSEYDAYGSIATQVLVSSSTRRYSGPGDLVASGVIDRVPGLG